MKTNIVGHGVKKYAVVTVETGHLSPKHAAIEAVRNENSSRLILNAYFQEASSVGDVWVIEYVSPFDSR